MVTVIYSWSLSNYLREGKDEGFDWFGLNRFGGGPEGGPGGPIDARGRFFGAWLLGIAGRTDFFGMRIWGFGFGLIRFEFATSFAPRFRFTSFFFGIKISSYSESSSSSTQILAQLFYAFSCASSAHLRSRNACNIEGIQTVYSTSILKKDRLVT